MLSNDAETRLREFNDTAFPKELITITDRVRIAVGWGHSNCIIVEGDTSLILIDTLDSDARAARLRDELSRLTDKPVKTIIYTHGHPDHRGGGGAFRDTVEEIIAFAPKKAVLKGTDRINPILNKRTFRQFGYGHHTGFHIIQNNKITKCSLLFGQYIFYLGDSIENVIFHKQRLLFIH